jgi:GNAT superfamily N-acetyltransferase
MRAKDFITESTSTKGVTGVVYHGSPSDFDEFDPYATMDGGFYFTADKRLAISFSKDEDGEIGTLYSARLTINNPKEIDLRGQQQPSQEQMQTIFDQAKAKGHDGIILHNIREFNGLGTQYVVFNPNQIKIISKHSDQNKEQDVAEDEEPVIKLADNGRERAKAWIEKVYELYPSTFQNNHVMMWGEGEDQQFAMFELVPSFSKRGAVEVKWISAHPLRQGVGSRAMKELQRLAHEDGISLTLFPWAHGQVSPAKLTKFYKGQGFKPTAKGAKTMAWEPPVSENMDHSKDGQAVEELKAALVAHGDHIRSMDSDDEVYNIINKIMTRIAKSHGISGQKLHDMWVAKYKQIPDTWVMKTHD